MSREMNTFPLIKNDIYNVYVMKKFPERFEIE